MSLTAVHFGFIVSLAVVCCGAKADSDGSNAGHICVVDVC